MEISVDLCPLGKTYSGLVPDFRRQTNRKKNFAIYDTPLQMVSHVVQSRHAGKQGNYNFKCELFVLAQCVSYALA